MPQPGQDPALDHLYCHLCFGLVFGFVGPGRQYGGTIVRGQLGIGGIDLRCIAAGLGDRGLEVVRHQQLRHATEEAQHALMGADPVGQ